MGYSRKTLGVARWKLRKLELVEKRGGLWWPTERGKITLAIIMGQETRARGERAERKMVEQRLPHNIAERGSFKWRKVCNEHKPRIILASAVVHERMSK